MGLELFTNYGLTTASGSSGTTSPASGTSETWTVASSASFPAASSTNGTQFHIADPALPTEVIAVTNVSGTTWTVTRGAEGTTPVAHTSGFTIKNVVTAGWLGAGICVIPPSGDVTGATDAANINAAFQAYFTANTGGTVMLLGGDYYINAQITVPLQRGTSTDLYGCSLKGQRGATYIHQLGATGIYAHRTLMWGPVQNNQPDPMGQGPQICDFRLDGSSAPTGAIGMDVGDSWGLLVDCEVSNFYTAGAIGVNQINRVSWTEKCTFRIHSINNTTHFVVDSTGTHISHEYNNYDLYMYMLGGANTTTTNGQVGMVWQNGSFMGGGELRIRGNHGGGGAGTGGIVLNVTGNDGSGDWSQIYNSSINITVEGNSVSNLPVLINLGNANNTINGFGQVVAQYGGWNTSTGITGGNFAVSGRIHGDTALSTPPTLVLGATTVTETYNGPDCLMSVSGGTVSQITINGVNSGLTSGVFLLKNNSTYAITYTGAPTLHAIPASL